MPKFITELFILTENHVLVSTEKFQQIARGDTNAFQQLFEAYRTRLFSFALDMTKSPTDAEDIVQEVFIKVWNSRERLAVLDKPLPYLYAMTRNHVFDFLQKAGRNQQMIDDVWTNMQSERVESDFKLLLKESGDLIMKAVSQLPAAKRRIFLMSRDEGLSNSQIAERVGLSSSRVKNILVETLKYIRAYLNRHASPLSILCCFSCLCIK